MDEPEDQNGGIRVLIVDDHPLFRAGIRERLHTDDDSIVVVGEAHDGAQARELVSSLTPNVVLMDIAMQGMNGIEATRLIHSEFPEVGIIILSVYDDTQYVRKAIEAGASGYLLKTVEPIELKESIKRVAHGESALSGSVARALLTRLSDPSAESGQLSVRELQVLQLAANGASNRTIGQELFLSTRTVEAHMRNIFDKLGVSSRMQAVTEAVRHQWIRLPDAD
ncbi:MAG: response regulator transcription factor [Candidatus Nanopelagicales bacterium]|nr:response regulator transcription factor [Candidatus Nanopelagicales bacterium]MDZ4248635.1 response regulator transcription factor [Candidatus Nanopelagicales bacterium]